MKKTVQKLALHQETLKNLTEDELRNIEGGNFSNPPRFTCPECAPPDTEAPTCMSCTCP